MKRLLCYLLITFVLGFATNAVAANFVFQDTVANWPGFGGDPRDVIAAP
jgi:hypothetical protein